MPHKLLPLRSMAFLMEDPTRSRAHPPSRVATTAVTMVTPPKVRSMDSRPTPNSSCPACVHAWQMACELLSWQQASIIWYNIMAMSRQSVWQRHTLQCALAGRRTAVSCQSQSNSQCHWLSDGWFEHTGRLLTALHRFSLETHSTHIYAVYTQLVSALLSLWLPLMQQHAAQGMLWVGHLGTKAKLPGD